MLKEPDQSTLQTASSAAELAATPQEEQPNQPAAQHQQSGRFWRPHKKFLPDSCRSESVSPSCSR